jgi:hypothetical protein
MLLVSLCRLAGGESMFKPNTVLIVGAGASAEVGLPIGTGLVEHIAGLVTIERNELTGALPQHKPFVRDLMNHAGQEKVPQYLHAARMMISGMRSAESIDRYIDREADDEFIRTLGKAAIVEAIAFRERKSKLYGDKGGPISGRSEIDDTWYWTFFRMLLEGSPPRDKLFDNIAIVCFNYDRCIEHYLTCELMRAYSIERNEAADLVQRLTIWHPYGTIAPLDTQEPNGIAYGDNEAVSGRSFHLASRIQTFTEKHQDGLMIEAIRERIRAAENVVFLGFGYYLQNLQLIAPEQSTTIKWMLGTGHGLSDSDRYVVVQERLGPMFRSNNPRIEITGMRCVDLLANHRMALSA